MRTNLNNESRGGPAARSARLKEATWTAHQRVESRAWPRALARGEAEPEALGNYYGQLRLVHAALEEPVEAAPEIAAAVGWEDTMRHSSRLDADLAALGIAAPAPLAPTLALLRQLERAAAEERWALLGFLYVLEGSMNGNRFLARALRRGPAGERGALRYFESYGEAQPARWAAFKSALDEATLGPGAEAAVLAAALAAFAGITVIGESMPAPAAARD